MDRNFQMNNVKQLDGSTILRGIAILFFTAVLIYLAVEYTKKHKNNDEKFRADIDDDDFMNLSEKKATVQQAMPSEPLKNEDFKQVDFKTKKSMPKDCFPKDKLTADDLLPKDAANSKWAQVNPAGQGDLKDQNFLNAGYHVGINTVGSSLRNPNMQLRSEPPNPQMKVSPWNQTTIESDLNRKPLEIGGCE